MNSHPSPRSVEIANQWARESSATLKSFKSDPAKLLQPGAEEQLNLARIVELRDRKRLERLRSELRSLANNS